MYYFIIRLKNQIGGIFPFNSRGRNVYCYFVHSCHFQLSIIKQKKTFHFVLFFFTRVQNFLFLSFLSVHSIRFYKWERKQNVTGIHKENWCLILKIWIIDQSYDELMIQIILWNILVHCPVHHFLLSFHSIG